MSDAVMPCRRRGLLPWVFKLQFEQKPSSRSKPIQHERHILASEWVVGRGQMS